MTENTPARTGPGTELERREAPVSRADTDSWTQVVGITAKLAAEIAGTEFVPRGLRGKPAAVTAAILYGREIGLPPMTALTQTHVVEGRPSASAEAMRALVIAAGHEIVFAETTGAICTVRGRRRGSSTWTEVTWSIDMARAAGLATKDNWRNYPRRMLQARASSELCELVFPDVVLGMRSTEELEDEGKLGEIEAPAETTVSAPRKRATSARKSAAAAPPTDARPAPATAGGMPLPGEDGYVEPTRKADTPPQDAAGADLAADEPESDPTPAEPAPGPSETEILVRLTPGPSEAEIDAAGPDEPDEDGAVEADVVDDEAHEEERPTPAPITRAQVRMIAARIGTLAETAGVKLEDGERRGIVRVLAGREEPLDSTNSLSKAEGHAVIETLTRVGSLEELYAIVEATVEALRQQAEPS